ncbi:MAG: DUF4445 domain-containing protein [Anaerolineae bacterium]|nr:DUF4445 domain-containing protein [Anaerolineae bacterium]
MSFEVDFEPLGQRVSCKSGDNLLDAAQRAGIMLNAICGGEGVCGRCVVRVMAGKVSSPNIAEEEEMGKEQLDAGWRLACQTEVEGNVQIYIPPSSLATAQRTQTEGQGLPVEPQPAVRAFDVEQHPPSIHDLRSDASRLRDALDMPALTFPTAVLRTLSTDLRDREFRSAVFVSGSSVVGVASADARPLGLAVDLGTTKLAAYLVDLAGGETLAKAGAMNPQIAFGEDVMARIGHAISKPDGAEQLRIAVVEALNGLARDLCEQTAHPVHHIADAVIVGNTAMHHLFLGLPVRQLGLAPYVAAESAALDVQAHDVGLDFAPGANVHLLPNIAGFVGADHVAMLLASGMPEHEGIVLGMDIGTNTEISLIAKGKHFACSTASGPAFEGAHIRHGMRAAPGAIEKVLIRDDEIMLQTIDDKPPVGLCGSGILDLVAQLRKANIIDRRGALDKSGDNPRIRQGDKGLEYVVVPAAEDEGREITFNRKDVNEIQLAKGAMRAGVQILLQRAGITEEDIDTVIVAGAFGTYLDVQSGITIGMFPQIEARKFVQVGNAAGAGACMALLSTAIRKQAADVAHHVTYVELTAEKGFSSLFARNLFFDQHIADGL